MSLPPFDRRRVPPGLRFHDLAGEGGWRLRGYDWPANEQEGGAARGSILFQSGRADFVEKYFEAIDHWHGQGWNVAGFDWRGQGGSAREGAATGSVLDAMLADATAEVRRWIARTPPPHVLIGHSMGGHLLLRLLAEQRVDVAAAVLAAPMLGLAHAPLSAGAARALARLACALGRRDAPLWAGKAASLGRQGRLTGCVDRYADEGWWRETDPALQVDPPTWGWLRQAMDSIARLDAPGVLESVTVPVLLVATDRDRLVSAAAIRRATARLPDARLVMLDGAHELLRESDPVRTAAFEAIDDFLDEKAPRA
ncbi:alpha/beta hydrolase [Sphingomonas solaris]|uniref:Alpha/beta hydrolase n=1 Tax=Alterirhizorhabdus solaris TaxID=2529389 RepID=A0A558QZ78_9SPHN|nr:alpha/beta hydrolase [Sphingomonas solaris]TVV72367.1 alpha/beta hydrolase [Sphingomonas solaris]